MSPDYNYGARQSLRETVSVTRSTHYFQAFDRHMHARILETHVVRCIVEFLDERGVDISHLKKQETTILNNIVNNTGMTVNAGEVHTGDVVVGQGARVVS
jgi:hypothetical protein